jgi:hypothetical protein
MRAHKMSPKMPASVTPIASTTATQPAVMASMAARVEIGLPHDAGVARSSRAGTKRSVNARPMTRRCFDCSGRLPRSQTRRSPFFSSTVVNVAVVTCINAASVPAGNGFTSMFMGRSSRRSVV